MRAKDAPSGPLAGVAGTSDLYSGFANATTEYRGARRAFSADRKTASNEADER
jgi:hypothetical protein